MLGIAGHRVAAFVSGPHGPSVQSFLVLVLALGCSSGAALRGFQIMARSRWHSSPIADKATTLSASWPKDQV